MLRKLFLPDPFKVFYIVFIYIITFSLWWGYLLYAKNETAYREKIELDEQRYKQTNTTAEYKNSAEYIAITNKYERQKVMILTEGSVFFVFLLAGLILVRRVFKREIELAALQRNFLLSITHELKSPLSSIKLALQTLQKRKPDAEKSEKLLTNSLADIERLDSLVDNILFAAKIEKEHHGFNDEEINASDLLQVLVEKFEMNKKQIKIECAMQSDVMMNVDPSGFTSVIVNLVENAIKYSDPDTTIKLALQQTNNETLLTVTDEGISIPDSLKERVFEKFYRIGNEDTRKTKGTGLGLYIVKRFVEIYHGSISITDNKPRGSIFTIRLPALMSSSD